MNPKSFPLFASCDRGLEELLKKELLELGAKDIQIVQGGVTYLADESTLYRTLLWSRVASRIFLSISHFEIYSDLDLYSCVHNIHWSDYFGVEGTFAIHFIGTNDDIRNSQYGALKVKDGIVDHFMRKFNQRPIVDKAAPEIRIQVHLHQNRVSVSLDLSGESLHKRGYRLATGDAPMKENLAVAVLKRSGWDKHSLLLDPMCGSGTLVIEAAMMAINKAPGLLRKNWGFLAWKGFNPTLWNEQIDLAKTQIKPIDFKLIGYDKDQKVLERAKENAKQAGVLNWIEFAVKDVIDLTSPNKEAVGTIVCNPPYGERLASEPALIALYTVFGERLKSEFKGWAISIFSGNEALLNCLKMRSHRQFKAKNGAIDCLQKNYKIHLERIANPSTLAAQSSVSSNHATKTQTIKNALEKAQPEKEIHAQDFLNRLKKNKEKLDKWAQKEGLDCYRIYDADLPDYNLAIDRYKDYFVLQEYQAPKNVDPNKAKQRIYDVIQAMINGLNLKSDQLILKTRERQKGKRQYQTLAKQKDFFWVKEYQCQFLVNLTDYLDTGLFLDHRLARKMIGEKTKNLDFLNLFAYTGTASVYAGLGGAKSTTTVDLSHTYLGWAAQNLDKNGLTGKNHRLIQADCLYYLENVQEQFDFIFIDPPTFSNSKRMQDSFDVQRDHLQLMAHLKRILRPNGTILFSNNRRGFKLDEAGLTELGLSAQNITNQTISLDFKRHSSIHNAYLIRFKS